MIDIFPLFFSGPSEIIDVKSSLSSYNKSITTERGGIAIVSYKETAQEVMKTLKTTPDGLNQDERISRLKENGYNHIEVKKKVSPLRKFLKHLTELLMIILLVASLLKFFTGEVIEGSIILAVVLVNSFVGYWQGRKAEEALNGLETFDKRGDFHRRDQRIGSS